MAYGIIRVRNLSAGDLKLTEIHNARKYEQMGMKLPDNIDPQRCRDGEHFHESAGDKTISEGVNKYLQLYGITPRKNSVVALEYVVALSGNPKEKEKMNRDPNMLVQFLDDASDWISKRHGNNLVSFSLHGDESNLHAHIVVLPVVEKKVRWKNQKGEGERVENRLCARDYTGGPDLLRKLQDEFHQFVEPYGAKMGVKFYRGTKKEEQLKEYTKKTSHELGLLRQKLDLAKTEAEAKAVKLEIEAKKAEFEIKQGKDGRIVEKHREQQKKDDKWKKGLGFKRGF